MAVIDLTMAVEVDTEQLDKLQEKMKQTDEVFLKKIEKATSILPKGAEKVNHAWLQMVSKVGVYVDKFLKLMKRGFGQVCRKICNAKQDSLYHENKLIRAIIAAAKKHKPAMKKRTAIKFLLLSCSEGVIVKSLPQYRHTIASSLISSAQYGHFFMTNLHLEGSFHA
jgi:hypothetical protein